MTDKNTKNLNDNNLSSEYDTADTSPEQSSISDTVYNTPDIEDIPKDLYDFTDNEVHSYVKLSDKYSDIMSSATTMLFVGIAGIIFMALVLTKIIPIPLNPETSWLFNSVMGGIFIIFVIAGIVSYMHAKQVKIDAEEEDSLIKDILEWAEKNITVSDIDASLDLSQPNELLYFVRADFIKDAIMHEFENTDEALVLELTEQIYQKLYESEF